MSNDKKTVLIAEDEDDLREMYVMALSNGGFEVLQARDGNEVLELLGNKFDQIDVILLDIIMPGTDGFEALKKIKKDERFKKIPVLISTNLDDEDDHQQAINMGAKDYFVKAQHSPAELVEKIKLIFDET